MGKLLDGIIFGVYIVISVFAIVLAIAGAILKPNTDNSRVPNDHIFVNDHDEALKRGTQLTDVEVKRYGW